MFAPSEPLAHYGHLGTDNLHPGGRHKPLALIQRQAESFGDREIVALDLRHLRLRDDTRFTGVRASRDVTLQRHGLNRGARTETVPNSELNRRVLTSFRGRCLSQRGQQRRSRQ